jgi:hypothetical protein
LDGGLIPGANFTFVENVVHVGFHAVVALEQADGTAHAIKVPVREIDSHQIYPELLNHRDRLVPASLRKTVMQEYRLTIFRRKTSRLAGFFVSNRSLTLAEEGNGDQLAAG